MNCSHPFQFFTTFQKDPEDCKPCSEEEADCRACFTCRAITAVRVGTVFLDPDEAQLRMAAELEAEFVELHTGAYANARGDERARELERLARAAETAESLGLRVNAGHGLDYDNVTPVVALPHLEELNIGHSIVARALTDGVGDAIRSMLALLESRP